MPGQASSVPRSAIRRPGSLTYARCTDARLLRTLFRLDRRGLPCPLRLSPTQSRSPQQPPAKAPTALAGGDNNDEDGDEDDDDNSNDSDTTTTAREQGDSARQHHSFAGSLSRAAASSTTADTSHTAVPFCSLPARPSPSSLSRVPLAGPAIGHGIQPRAQASRRPRVHHVARCDQPPTTHLGQGRPQQSPPQRAIESPRLTYKHMPGFCV